MRDKQKSKLDESNLGINPIKLVIPVSGLPIPAVKGGAIQTGIQQIIDENEKYGLMRIIIFSTDDNQARDAAKKYQYTRFFFIKSTPRLTFVVRVVNKILRELGVKKQFPRYYSFIMHVVKELENIEYDYILVKNNIDFVIPLSNNGHTDIYLQMHNDFFNSKTYNAEKIYNSCRKILVNSQYIKRRILSIENSNPDKILVNRNCTDTKIFNKSLYTDKIKILKQKYSIRDNDVVIMFSGRISPQKGVAELISAVKKLPNNMNFKLLIIGSKWFGENSKDQYFKHLTKISKEISDKIIFTGYIPYTEVPIIHAISDIAVVPSIWEEPAGRVVIEAEASGLPVIVSNSGGVSDYICEGSAIVVKRGPSFEEDLCESLKKLICDPELRWKMGQCGKIFAQKFNPETYYRELYDYLVDVSMY